MPPPRRSLANGLGSHRLLSRPQEERALGRPRFHSWNRQAVAWTAILGVSLALCALLGLRARPRGAPEGAQKLLGREELAAAPRGGREGADLEMVTALHDRAARAIASGDREEDGLATSLRRKHRRRRDGASSQSEGEEATSSGAFVASSSISSSSSAAGGGNSTRTSTETSSTATTTTDVGPVPEKVMAVPWTPWTIAPVSTITSTLATTPTSTNTPNSATATATTAADAAAQAEKAPDRCLGLGACPMYPLPYEFGEWPTSYRIEGEFPKDFAWGMGTAAYQIEGAYREDGRGASIWDTFTGADTVGMPGADCSYCCKAAPCPANPGMLAKGATGNVACDHYHRWKEDVALMKSMGLKHYRFSISWPRLVPTGRVEDGVNQKAMDFYNGLIDALIAAGITPYVTLYHWDLPQALLDPAKGLQGWWSRDEATGIPNCQPLKAWLDYANVCFSSFGDRVKTWITFNEAWTFTWLGSGYGKAPGIPEFMDQARDPYIAGHNVLLAHAMAVDLYRRRYAPQQGGQIGITNNCDWREPATLAPRDVGAAELAVEFSLGWFSDPIFGGSGDYPRAMRELLGSRLPEFTEEQKRLLNGSADFIGLNHYGSAWAAFAGVPGVDNTHLMLTEESFPRAQSQWLYSSPWGFRKVLNYIDRRYRHPAIYVTENGWSLAADTAQEGKRDLQRVQFYANYTSEMLRAIREDGVDIRGYFAWSLLDNFEWDKGYVERFGTTYIEFGFGEDPNSPLGSSPRPTTEPQLRTRKDSSCWLEAVWRANRLVDPSDGGFAGCADSFAIAGDYSDPKFPSCSRSLQVAGDGRRGQIVGRDGLLGPLCIPDTGPAWVANASFSGGTVLADFSGRGGPKALAGFWDRVARTISWGDGSTWIKKVEDPGVR